ncbi:ATP-binding protein [Ramlibacter sp. H39-3-26]|uniref:ATP-binding protein n=1 Tax=Curvibacter soli TaxID=3031331 RepID=UPI0023D9C9ED|nr:ATP-binding protein [Ramlibacter sp. H39-3-26]MDF1485423.1 ATP-binding protein [Ramlibacter sp. H39-3-26]
MSLQRRLLLYLLVCAPLVWGVALYLSISRTQHEVNELFDAELIRLARQIQATLGPGFPSETAQLPAAPRAGAADKGDADVRDFAVAIWDRSGRLLLSDREGVQLQHRPNRSGFIDEDIDGKPWRAYYLQSFDGRWLVAAAQRTYERNELVYGLTVTQIVPWLLLLPILLAVMASAIRRALSPMARLTEALQGRPADDLRPLAEDRAPAELKPLLSALNGLFQRIEKLLVRERRFTAEAAHELRTPLAVLRAQWDVVRRSSNPIERTKAEDKLSTGIDRMGRLVTQMLALSRVESGTTPAFNEVCWTPIVEQAVSDCLALAERRGIDLACEWPLQGRHPMPLLGDEHLLAVLLRNLLDNAVRYAPAGTGVTLRIASDTIEVENQGPALTAEQLAQLGERFYRPDGQQEGGSGLGLSIVRRIAELHGLEFQFGPLADGSGVKAILRRDAAHR